MRPSSAAFRSAVSCSRGAYCEACRRDGANRTPSQWPPRRAARPWRVSARGTELGTERKATELGAALRTVSRVLKRRSLVLILSDFRAPLWERPLGELARRHDAVAIRISDRSDLELPRAGSFYAADPETDDEAWLPLRSPAFRARWRARGTAERAYCLEACARSRVSLLEMDTEDDPALKLLDFFERRRAR